MSKEYCCVCGMGTETSVAVMVGHETLAFCGAHNFDDYRAKVADSEQSAQGSGENQTKRELAELNQWEKENDALIKPPATLDTVNKILLDFGNEVWKAATITHSGFTIEKAEATLNKLLLNRAISELGRLPVDRNMMISSKEVGKRLAELIKQRENL